MSEQDRRLRLSVAGENSFAWREKTHAWALSVKTSGQCSIPIHRVPFVIGRALDCQLILPETAELCKTTSRWHCHIGEKDGALRIMDGSPKPPPGASLCKPSIGGTSLNGQRVTSSQKIKAGDRLKIGPWEFAVEPDLEGEVGIDDMLTRMVEDEPRRVDPGETDVRSGFGRLHSLFAELQKAASTDEALALILCFAIRNIKAAEVAAVILTGPGAPTVRIAWQRDTGRILGLKVSKGLLKELPEDRAYLLRCEIKKQTESQHAEDISSGLLVPILGGHSRTGILYMDNRYGGKAFSEEDLYLANALAAVVSLHLGFEKQTFLDNIERSMSRYFGPEVVRMILQQARKGKSVGLEVRESEMTVMFVDMAGFSAFSRQHSPQEVVLLLNPYFELVSRRVQENGGHVDKFIGDAVMAVFGAHPFTGLGNGATKNHAVQAVRAAQEIVAQWKVGGVSPLAQGIHLRVGISSGKVVVGNVGFPERMEYSVMGDTVNLASRLEKLAPQDGIAVSDRTFQLLGGWFQCTDPMELEIKGFGRVPVRAVEICA